MSKVKITTTIDPQKRKAAEDMGYEVSDILDKALDQCITGIVIKDSLLYQKLQRKRKEMMSKIADLTVKEMAIVSKKQALELEVKAISAEIGTLESDQKEEENSDKLATLMRELNKIIVDMEYDEKAVNAEASMLIEEIKTIMPTFDLNKQIEIMKSFST